MASLVDIRNEFDLAPLPDVRLQGRLLEIARSAVAHPGRGFPAMFATSAELEGFYRFVENDRVDWQTVVRPHIEATIKRSAEFEEIVVAHDTCEYRFGGRSDRKGLTRGRTASKSAGPRSKQGFLCHFALAITAGDDRAPLGVVSMDPWARQLDTKTARIKAGAKEQDVRDLESEQDRWWRGVQEVERQIEPCRVIHVMDSEADDYALLAKLSQRKSRFVIRMGYDRLLCTTDGDRGKTRERVSKTEVLCTRDVTISARNPLTGNKTRKRDQARAEREATLSFQATSVVFRRPNNRKGLPEQVPIHIVHVKEVDPPQGVIPVEWTLATTEPIGSQQQVLRVVDHYIARWRIEEYFKAIKTGCAFEKRQLESLSTLLVALAIFVPVAWQLLQLRTLGRQQPDRPAATCFPPQLLKVLLAAVKPRLPKTKTVGAEPTMREAMLYVARIGGYIEKPDREPGWQILGRGLLELLAIKKGVDLAAGIEM